MVAKRAIFPTKHVSRQLSHSTTKHVSPQKSQSTTNRLVAKSHIARPNMLVAKSNVCATKSLVGNRPIRDQTLWLPKLIILPTNYLVAKCILSPTNILVAKCEGDTPTNNFSQRKYDLSFPTNHLVAKRGKIKPIFGRQFNSFCLSKYNNPSNPYHITSNLQELFKPTKSTQT